MELAFYCNPGDLNLHGGYGIAGHGIVSSLNRLGHGVAILPHMPTNADVQFNFAFPSIFADYLTPKRKQIYCCVWESSLLQDDWHDILEEVDEFWTATEWCKNMLEANGYPVSTVYPHGIDPMWKPRRRQIDSKLVFLHDGEPTTRKNGQLAYNAFRAAFGDADDVQLVIKSKGPSTIRNYDRFGSIRGDLGKNVTVITQTYEELESMVALYHKAHCLVMPSAGEGFGYPGLQALATGIPAICTAECAPYIDYLGTLGLESTYIDSPWPTMHPGQILKPDFDNLVEKYRFVYSNYDSIIDSYYKQSFSVHAAYDWDTLTKKAFEPIFNSYLTSSKRAILNDK
jgi:glycosyltransferase involved in cell wall biosynthesis